MARFTPDHDEHPAHLAAEPEHESAGRLRVVHSDSTRSSETRLRGGRRPIGLEVGDEELALRMQDGDTWAKEAFYRKHVEQAYRVARRLVRDSHDAEDVVQEAFSQAFRDINKLREPAASRGWLMRIVVNRAHRKFRRRNILRVLGLEKSTEESLPHVAAADSLSAEASAELALASKILDKASLACRSAWILRHVEGYTLSEAAEATGCSLATVKRRIREVNLLLEAHLSPSPELPSQTQEAWS